MNQKQLDQTEQWIRARWLAANLSPKSIQVRWSVLRPLLAHPDVTSAGSPILLDLYMAYTVPHRAQIRTVWRSFQEAAAGTGVGIADIAWSAPPRGRGGHGIPDVPTRVRALVSAALVVFNAPALAQLRVAEVTVLPDLGGEIEVRNCSYTVSPADWKLLSELRERWSRNSTWLLPSMANGRVPMTSARILEVARDVAPAVA